MKISEIIEKLGATEVSVAEPDREISGGYAGDFLSFVMGKAPSNCAWFTVMSNVNVAAVALLAEVGVIVLCEDVTPTETLVDGIAKEKLNLIKTKLDTYNAILAYNA